MVDRLADDHANAKKLAKGLAQMHDISINPDHIHTNIIFFEITLEDMKPEKFVQQLDAAGIRVLPVGAGKVRAVTHYQITSEDIDQTLDVISKVMKMRG
jgi:threonine aldolase